jgi:hypothetical protein
MAKKGYTPEQSIKKLRELEQENSSLKKLVADLSPIIPFSKRPQGETSKPVP